MATQANLWQVTFLMCSFIKAHRQERAVPGTGNGLWRGHGGRGAFGHNGSRRSEEDEGWGWQARVTSEEQTDLGQEEQVPKPWVWPWPWHWVNYKRREWASIEVAEWRKAKGSAQELPASQLAANPDWLIKRRLKMDGRGLLLACFPSRQGPGQSRNSGGTELRSTISDEGIGIRTMKRVPNIPARIWVYDRKTL